MATGALPLESVIGFEGKVGGGLVLHPNGKTMAYPLGATVVVKELGDFMVTPTDSAGFPAAMSADGAMAAILADASTQRNVLLEISTKDGKLLRTVRSHTPLTPAAPPCASRWNGWWRGCPK